MKSDPSKNNHLLIGILTCGIMLYFGSVNAQIILTSDQQLNNLMDPDKKIELSTGYQKRYASLREVCEELERRGKSVLTIAFDEFFRQYRDHEKTERKLTPDMDEYVGKIKVIADFAADYGLAMGLTLLSPLELGPGFKRQTGKNGQWLHYKVGLRDSKTGKFNVPIWQQLNWTNNKGKFSIELADYTVYAFKEEDIPNTPYKAVDREDIIELKDPELESWGASSDFEANSDGSANSGGNANKFKRVRVYSDGSDELKGYNKVLVVLTYDVPEMDYFSPEALPFLKKLLKKYDDKGIQIGHFYSDEMHIQQDWSYFDHHDNGQFALRYHTPSLAKRYEDIYNVPFEQKDILYFAYGLDINSHNVTATENVQYVMGKSIIDIQKTFLFRHRYYKLLNNHVVDLFKAAKDYASSLFGVDDFDTRGHSSWAQSPTIDYWETESLNRNAYKYEYTPNFIWGNTVHQAASACYDYFKWGEYLEPTRNDFGEGGWNDRNYYGAAMATSLGVVNDIPNAYPAVWGMPAEVRERRVAVNDAFGGRPRSKAVDLVTGHVHRDVDVLILYPMDLVAVEERFGSWMSQYGYANFITSDKLLELGSINSDGELIVKGQKYTTLVAMFEPLPEKKLLDLFGEMTKKGGRAVWFGPPPIIDIAGEKCLEQWQSIFGVNYEPKQYQGQIAAGKKIEFSGGLESVPDQNILTHFLVDRIYPVEPLEGTRQVAFCDNNILVGSVRGNASFFGFRPRDDQSASLGYETRTLFEILDALGAYKPTGKFPNVNDNTEHVSRTTDFLATRFPNGATVIVKHYRKHRETWYGGFSRDKKRDSLILLKNPLPSDTLNIKDLKVNGHNVSYQGRLSVAFRMNNEDELIAFDGQNCKEIEIDGKTWEFSKAPIRKISFAPSLNGTEENQYELYLDGDQNLTVSIPIPQELRNRKLHLTDQRGNSIKFKLNRQEIKLNLSEKIKGKWLILGAKS